MNSHDYRHSFGFWNQGFTLQSCRLGSCHVCMDFACTFMHGKMAESALCIHSLAGISHPKDGVVSIGRSGLPGVITGGCSVDHCSRYAARSPSWLQILLRAAVGVLVYWLPGRTISCASLACQLQFHVCFKVYISAGVAYIHHYIRFPRIFCSDGSESYEIFCTGTKSTWMFFRPLQTLWT